jgi:hypothetical protein
MEKYSIDVLDHADAETVGNLPKAGECTQCSGGSEYLGCSEMCLMQRWSPLKQETAQRYDLSREDYPEMQTTRRSA